MSDEEDQFEVRIGQQICACPRCGQPIELGPWRTFTRRIGMPGCDKCNWTGYQIGGPDRDPVDAAKGVCAAYPCPHCNKPKVTP